MGMRDASETRNYPKNSSEVFSAITKALDEFKMKVINKDESKGIITATTGFSLFSTGTDIIIEIQPISENKEVSLTINAKPKMKTVVTDWGQSSRDVGHIFNKVEEYLGIVAEKPKATEGKVKVEGIKELRVCPFCGQSVGATDKFCGHCGKKL